MGIFLKNTPIVNNSLNTSRSIILTFLYEKIKSYLSKTRNPKNLRASKNHSKKRLNDLLLIPQNNYRYVLFYSSLQLVAIFLECIGLGYISLAIDSPESLFEQSPQRS